MNRKITAVVATVAAAVFVNPASIALADQYPASLCVGPAAPCFATIQAALRAASDGDTIRIAAGIWGGGVTVTKSVRLVGAGAGTTIIRGGGPVLTIGIFKATAEPTVSIEGVTITGGVARSSPVSIPFVGHRGVWALGGGVEIPPNADFSGGATVTITDSVITRNRVAPARTVPSGIPCPGGECPFAFAGGGGIDTWGRLTLVRTTVSHNRAGSNSHVSNLASDAVGGAITNWLDSLTVTNSVIRGNRASATGRNGRFAESGAIQVQGGTLRMSGSDVQRNRAVLHASFPNSVDTLTVGGAIHITGNAAGTIRHSTISGNTAVATNTVGDAVAFSGGVHTDVDFTLSDDVFRNNSVRAVALPGSSGSADGDSGAGEMGGTIRNSRFTGNTVMVRSAAGDATASAGSVIFAGTMSNSVISRNHVRGTSPHGHAAVRAGGLWSGGTLTLRHTTISGNKAHARGRTGSGLGGGIFAAAVPNGPPVGPLTLIESRITHNALSGSAHIRLHGGGVYATDPVTSTNTITRHNRPDQCYGYSC